MGRTDRKFLQVFLLVWCLLLLKMSICDDHAARLDCSPFKSTPVVIIEYKLIYKNDRINFLTKIILGNSHMGFKVNTEAVYYR